MTRSRSVKARRRDIASAPVQDRDGPRHNPATARFVVGVIASMDDLRLALQTRRRPDFFEVRLDCLSRSSASLDKKLRRLKAPLIITARHPAEGGANNLSLKQRLALFSDFLHYAAYIDVELRSAKSMRSLLECAKRRKIGRIISFHDFNSTPSPRSLRAKAKAAKSFGADIFKIATRTDTPAQLVRLFEFVANKDAGLAVSAMGIGKLGAVSRIVLFRRGSTLNYASIGARRLQGQLSIQQLRSVVGH